MWEYILNNYFTIYGIIVAVSYVLWLGVVVPIISKVTGDGPDFTDIEEFFGITAFLPLCGAGVLLAWPIVFPLALLAGLFLGVFYLNKYRVENKKEKSDAVSGW